MLKRKIRVMGKSFPILVSPDAQLKYLKLGSSSFDADLIQIAELVTCDDEFIWDIGANVGVFSVAALAASPKSRVIAVEADPWLADLLVRTSEFDAYKKRELLVLAAAASDEFGISEFLIAGRGRASNALAEFVGRSQMGGARRRQLVPTVTIDAIAAKLGQPNFIKIDVEGAELAVLRGAKKTLNKSQPALYIETSKETFRECSDLLRSLGYEVFDSCGHQSLKYDPNSFFIHKFDKKHLGKLAALHHGRPLMSLGD